MSAYPTLQDRGPVVYALELNQRCFVYTMRHDVADRWMTAGKALRVEEARDFLAADLLDIDNADAGIDAWLARVLEAGAAP